MDVTLQHRGEYIRAFYGDLCAFVTYLPRGLGTSAFEAPAFLQYTATVNGQPEHDIWT